MYVVHVCVCVCIYIRTSVYISAVCQFARLSCWRLLQRQVVSFCDSFFLDKWDPQKHPFFNGKIDATTSGEWGGTHIIRIPHLAETMRWLALMQSVH